MDFTQQQTQAPAQQAETLSFEFPAGLRKEVKAKFNELQPGKYPTEGISITHWSSREKGFPMAKVEFENDSVSVEIFNGKQNILAAALGNMYDAQAGSITLPKGKQLIVGEKGIAVA